MDIKPGPSWIARLASVELTLFCIGLAMIVIFFGTLAQVHMGTFAAQKEFFNSWFVTLPMGGVQIPIFPGGLIVGALWMINLLAAFVERFKFRRKDAGILMSHLGLIVLLLGQFLTQSRAVESQMALEIGQTKNYSESGRETELVLVDTSDPQSDLVTRVGYSVFSHRKTIPLPGRPVTLVIRRFFKNAELSMGGPSASSLATQGIGPQIVAIEKPPVSLDDEVNNTAAYVEVIESGRSLGVWLVSLGLGAPQTVLLDGRPHQIAIRLRRTYYPFSLTLKDFRHDRYPGTDIPKNFSSLVHIRNAQTGEDRDALIYMNNPLRYEGETFYQASFGKGDRLSILQVVRNPAWLGPYIGCVIVTLGLLIQFLMHLIGYVRKLP